MAKLVRRPTTSAGQLGAYPAYPAEKMIPVEVLKGRREAWMFVDGRYVLLYNKPIRKNNHRRFLKHHHSRKQRRFNNLLVQRELLDQPSEG